MSSIGSFLPIDMEFEISKRERVTVLGIKGKLAMEHTPDFEGAILDLMDDGAVDTALDTEGRRFHR